MHTLRVFLKLCDLNLKKLLIHRASFFISLFLMSLWVAAYVTLIEVIFSHTKLLGGFTKGEVFIMIGCYYCVQNFSDIFFKDNIEEFGENMRRGELDFKLVKPAPSRLLALFWEMRFDHVASTIATGAVFAYGIRLIDTPLTFVDVGLGIGLMVVATIFYFSLMSIIASLTFWMQKNDAFGILVFNMTQLSRYPRTIYTGAVRTFLTFGLPLALIASLPGEAILHRENTMLILYFVGSTGVFYAFSKVFWYYGLRRYTSAN